MYADEVAATHASVEEGATIIIAKLLCLREVA